MHVIFRSLHFSLVHPWGGGVVFHSKGTWGCAVSKGIVFRTSSLAKVSLLAILVEFSLGKGMLLVILVEFSRGKGMFFGKFGQRDVKIN